MLKGKNILLGVTGSIAAFKALEIVRELKRLDANLTVCMTQSATKLITPLSFESLSGAEVITDLFILGKPLSHIKLTENLDLLAIVPATANILGKLAAGVADDALSTIFLATHAPVLVAPAMNEKMWEHRVVQRNVETLKALGCRVIDPVVGELACRSAGRGRLPDKETIMNEIIHMLTLKKDFKGKRLLVTASRTEEPLDPIRYVSNRASGKLGFAIAARANVRGAQVTLISGPSSLSPPPGVKLLHVKTSDEMRKEVLRLINKHDYLIMTAAISDFRPDTVKRDKIKAREITLRLIRTTDILKEVKERKPRSLRVIGFSLEARKGVERAREKLREKGLDMIVICGESVPGADEASVKVLSKSGKLHRLPRLHKDAIADELLDFIASL